jgi:hypothetical protein
MKSFMRRLPVNIPPALRLPLLGLLLCFGLSCGLASWAIADAEEKRRTLAHDKLRLRETAQALAQSRKDNEDAARGREFLAQSVDYRAASELDHLLRLLPPRARIDELATETHGQTPWQEYRFRLRTPLKHEGQLLRLLNAWRARSPMQHSIRQCQINRQASDIQADCELSYWTPTRVAQS